MGTSGRLAYALLLALASACRSVPCPADLTSLDGESCTCPPGSEERTPPIVLANGASDFCYERAPSEDASVNAGPRDDAEQPRGERPGDAAADEGPRLPASTRPNEGTQDTAASNSELTDAAAGPLGSPVVPPRACVPSDERCDQVDNDCDSAIDEQLACAPAKVPAGCTPTLWFRDCDGDGYAASTAGSAAHCAIPPAPDRCRGWTSREPSAGQVDCDDSTIAYSPGNGFGVRGLEERSPDLNCDGVVDIKIERVVEPSIVDRKPRDDAKFCQDPMGGLQSADCECFVLHGKGPEPPAPRCAAYVHETVPAFYRAYYTMETTICYGTVTFSTGTLDAYQLRVLCR